MVEETGNADQSTPRVYEIGEPVMVKDYRARHSRWTRGIIQDRIGPVAYRVQAGDLFWKRHLDQFRSVAGSKVADQGPTDQTDPEHSDPLPSLIPQQSRQEPEVLSCDPATSTPDLPSSVQNKQLRVHVLVLSSFKYHSNLRYSISWRLLQMQIGK